MATSSSRFRSGTKAVVTENRRMRMRHVYSEKFQETHMPKSAIIISDEGRWYGKSPSLFKKSHCLDPKLSPKIGKVNDKKEGQHS